VTVATLYRFRVLLAPATLCGCAHHIAMRGDLRDRFRRHLRRGIKVWAWRIWVTDNSPW
jgi:hypothetical protein